MPLVQGFLGVGTHLTDGVLVEPLASAGYARQPITIDTALSGAGGNDAPINFGPCTASWGAVGYAGLFDAAGNQVVAGALAAAVTIALGGTTVLSIAGGAITFQLGPAWASNLLLSPTGQIQYGVNNEPVTT
ncbi:MAG: hypothetical protein KGN77_01875 [Xanthomonadaceae bacterium]|nr:hypothetical protein [Xanthomonadaceae bacterium]